MTVPTLARLHQISVAIFLEEMGVLELTPVQYGILMVGSSSAGITQSDLATEIGIDRVTTGEVLQRLSKIGYLIRERSASDRRSIELCITRKGASMLRRASANAKSVQDRLLAPLALDDQKAFLEMMRRIVSASNHLGRAPLRLDRRTDQIGPNDASSPLC